ncbi:Reticulon-like protein B12 [Nymphaea thermarum]|nr:Reticulon-like protein B12 [Nymphaea thermarum]
MASPPARLFNRQRSIHEILGGGIVADVVLWRKKNVAVGILAVTAAAWIVFEKSGYTLLPPPPLPDMHVTEEMAEQTKVFLHSQINSFLSVSQDIVLGRDSKLFLKVAACLWIISVVGGLTDFLTLGYTSLVIVLTIPALYEKYETDIDRCVDKTCVILQKTYVWVDTEYLSKIRKWILEKRKLS